MSYKENLLHQNPTTTNIIDINDLFMQRKKPSSLFRPDRYVNRLMIIIVVVIIIVQLLSVCTNLFLIYSHAQTTDQLTRINQVLMPDDHKLIIKNLGQEKHDRNFEETETGERRKSEIQTIESTTKEDGKKFESNHVISKRDVENKIPNRLRKVDRLKKELKAELKYLTTVTAHPSCHLALELKSPGTGISFVFVKKDEITHNSIFDESQDLMRLVVKTPGTYVIYIQVTYNGRSGNKNPSCEHKVMLDPARPAVYGSKRISLLHGSTTQYKLGRVMFISPEGIPQNSIDSVYSSGIFNLFEGDKLFVQLDQFSEDCQVIKQSHKTFFGSYRLQSYFKMT